MSVTWSVTSHRTIDTDRRVHKPAAFVVSYKSIGKRYSDILLYNCACINVHYITHTDVTGYCPCIVPLCENIHYRHQQNCKYITYCIKYRRESSKQRPQVTYRNFREVWIGQVRRHIVEENSSVFSIIRMSWLSSARACWQ